MGTVLRIEDLAEPKLNEAQVGALAYGETIKVQFNAEVILDLARTRTGLSDFGPMDFLKRLEALCAEWDADKELTGLHRMVLFGYLQRYASNRLLLQDAFNKHPEIDQEVIARPVIVVGLPRSGTTHLVNLLAADDRFHSLPLWESYEPVPMPSEPMDADGTDPRYRRCAETWAGMQQVTPLLAAMHPMNPEHIHEELELMGPDFASYNFEWLCSSPRWRDHYYQTDQTPHYLYMKRVLKLLQWRRGGPAKPWVLKCPQHLEQIAALLKTFPDASVVFTHRDPVAVIQSTITMQAYTQRIQRPKPRLAELATYWIDRVEHLLQGCVRERALVAPQMSFDCYFDRFMADPWQVLEAVYANSGLPLDDSTRQKLTAYLQAHRRGKDGQMAYDLRRDFALEPAALHQRFAFYMDRFPVKREVT
jgi:hypothetical protein